ncbi:MAG: AmmeMemoRadiSam system protein B [Candidatus Brocadiia bacterium]|jgi:AmmeMemoRadiSam system protein B/AmmeMemoRadiSam system protein A
MEPARRGHFQLALFALHFALCVLLFGCGRSEPMMPMPSATAAAAEPSAPDLPAPKLAVRMPAVAGGFYPADPKALRATVDACLAEATAAEFKGRILALIAPHAGYEYSGRVAGFSFKQVRPGAFQRVIVLGPSHYGAFRGFSIMDVGAYATPLGEVPLDRPVCAKLAAHELHVRADEFQMREHSVEVELPFLQAALGEFRLVPILVGFLGPGDAEKIAAALREYLTPSTLVVISSDFTHYGASYEYVPFTKDIEQNLHKLDFGAVDLILAKDYGGYVKYMRDPAPTICGRFPIEVLLKLLPAEAEGRLLKYDTSGRVTGDFSLSVSYVSAMFTVPADWKPAAAAATTPAAPIEEKALTAEEKKTLLRIARDTLEAFVRTGRPPEIAADPSALTPSLKAECGAFVTLNKKNEGLRGCIGNIGYADPPLRRGLMPLYKTVANMTVEACSQDPRFEPVRAGELKDIELEISVLSLARQVRGPEDFEVGRHGIIIRKEGGGAVFLPQVAPEQHWTREETLDHLCVKAGWPPDEWRKPGMAFYTFTAQVFAEGQ